MKKIYTAPLTKVVKVNAETMICQSRSVTLQSKSIDGSEGGFEKADKDDFDDFGDLW